MKERVWDRFRTATHRSRAVHAVAVALALVPLAAAAATAPSPVPQPIVVGVASNTAANWPLYVAQSQDLFTKSGLSVQVVNAGSVAAVAQQLVAGSVDIGDVSSTQTVEAVQGGAPIHAVLNRVAKPTYELIAQKTITNVAQLKGKLIIVGGVNDITRIFTDSMLQSNGLRAGEYDYTYAGGTNERYAALKSGSVAAAILSPPYDFRAVDEGYTMLGSAVKNFPSFPFTGFAANDTWAAAHARTLVAFMVTHLTAVRWLYEPKNRAAAIEILAKATGSPPADAAKSYDELVVRDHAFSTTGRFAPAEEQQVIAALAKIGAVKTPLPAPTKFYDNRYVDEAGRELSRK